MFEMNFYSRRHDEIKKNRMIFRRIILAVLFVGVVVFSGFSLYMNKNLELQAQIDAQRAELNSAGLRLAVAESENTEAELTRLRSLNADLLARAEAFENSKVITTELFEHLIAALPADMYFSNMDFSAEGFNGSGTAVSMEVIAACEYNLKRLDEIADVFVQTHSNADGTYNFSVTAMFVKAEPPPVPPAEEAVPQEVSDAD